MMFELEKFVADCRVALSGDGAQRAIRDLVARAVSDPSALMRTIGEPRRGEVQTLHHADDLTILNVIWGPSMTIRPHNHRMWAVIGVYTGAEDNIFWRRAEYGRIEAAGAKALRARDVAPLGPELIHSVTNPIPRLTGAIHVYGGDFFTVPRNEWDAEALEERPYDVAHTLRLFEDSNRLLPA